MTASTRLARTVVLVALVPLAFAQDPNPKEILEKADAATLKVKSISYKAETNLEGASISATLKIIQDRDKEESRFPQFLMEAKINRGGDKAELTIANDGGEITRIDPANKTVRRMKAAGLGATDPQFTAPLQFVWMREYNHPKPFSDEINGEEQKFEGRKSVGGVECNVIFVKYKNTSPPQSARWYFGVQDNLPRKVERMTERGTSTLELTDVTIDPKLDPAIFAVKTPAGMEEDAPGQFGAGRTMPDFELKTADGKSVSLASLKGKTVLLQFWTGWDGPAKKALPALQRIADAEKSNEAIAVYGVYVWEKKDASAFLKENNYTFLTLIEGDKLAETLRIEKLPAFLVINPEGKISFSAAGWDEQRESELKSALKAGKSK